MPLKTDGSVPLSPRNAHGWDPLVESIHRFLVSCRGEFLPSAASIARSMHRDIVVVSAALRRLRDLGILEYRQGQRMRIAGRSLGADIDLRDLRPPRSRDKLVDSIRALIVAGRYRYGQVLPKRRFFAVQEHVSPTTVTEAYRQLERDGLVFRRGRSWVIGPPGRSYRGSPQCVLLVLPQSASWSRLHDERTGGFVDRFTSEAAARDIELVPCLLSGSQRATWRYPLGLREILRFYDANLFRIIGSLLVGDDTQYDDLGALIDRLLEGQRPVVWFDHRGLGFQREPLRRGLTRCTFSEETFSAQGLQTLLEAGHRAIGYVTIVDPESWSATRLSIVRQRVTSAGGRVHSMRDAREWLRAIPYEGLSRHLRVVASESCAAQRKALSFLLLDSTAHTWAPQCRQLSDPFERAAAILKNWPWNRRQPLESNTLGALACLMLMDRVTALIAARDKIALHILVYLDQLEVRMHDDISVVSYDNHLDATVLPVTTIDLGADALGYEAFRALTGEVSFGSGTIRNLVATPLVVHRGSVGPPSSSEIPPIS